MKFLTSVKNLFLTLEKFCIAVILIAMVLLSFTQVILRHFFSIGIIWGDVFLRHLVLWVGFLGASIATEEKKHFSIDFLKGKLPKNFRKSLTILIDLFAIFTLFYLLGSALKFFKDELQFRSILFSVGTVQVPSFWIDVIIPLGFFLLLLHFFFGLLDHLYQIFQGQDF
ncbi:MAG: TRAP transporter small permease subunit [Elusimicrobia bacterium]|nr:TRAP transporter small permease subunit [Elusimicrobiota bacterium]